MYLLISFFKDISSKIRINVLIFHAYQFAFQTAEKVLAQMFRCYTFSVYPLATPEHQKHRQLPPEADDDEDLENYSAIMPLCFFVQIYLYER